MARMRRAFQPEFFLPVAKDEYIEPDKPLMEAANGASLETRSAVSGETAQAGFDGRPMAARGGMVNYFAAGTVRRETTQLMISGMLSS